MGIFGFVFFPVTFRLFPNFCFGWGVISGVLIGIILLAFRPKVDSTQQILIFVTVTIVGLAASRMLFESEFRGTVMTLNWYQLLRSVPAILLFSWAVSHLNFLATNNPRISAAITILPGFWSTQIVVAFRVLVRSLKGNQ